MAYGGRLPRRYRSRKHFPTTYIENIAHALIRSGMNEHEAIAMAVAAVKRWAQGRLEWGRRKITPEVIAASRRAVAQWEALRATHDI